jgi:BirA family biotin operon repressor/biotin-[acetyl-CoA-carboxylase] ligase
MNLPPLPSGYTLVALDDVPSTNDEAARLAADGAADGTVVWARRQSAGRGRRGRQWISPEGNLYCSVLLRPDAPLARAAALSLVAAVAVGDMVAGFLPGRKVEHKWPNDILVEGAKIAGILLEASGGPRRRVEWVVIGCGVNLAVHPVGEGLSATDLGEERGAPVEAGEALAALLRCLHGWRGRWETAGIRPVRDAWLARARGLGGEIAVRLPREEIRGRFEGLDETGALLLRLADSTVRTISAGDVFFR